MDSASPRREHPQHLCEERWQVPDVFENVGGEDQVEALVCGGYVDTVIVLNREVGRLFARAVRQIYGHQLTTPGVHNAGLKSAPPAYLQNSRRRSHPIFYGIEFC